MNHIEYQKLDNISVLHRTLSKQTFFYSQSKKGKPLSRIELYQSGANRIIRRSEFAVPQESPDRKENDIKEFSSETRRRYFNHINSLDLSDMQSVFFMTFTIHSYLDNYLTKDNFKNACTSLFKKLSRQGFDFVYKVEYTLGCVKAKEIRCNKRCILKKGEHEIICQYNSDRKPVPHLHILAYSKHKYGFETDFDRCKKAYQYSRFWTDSLFSSLGLELGMFYIDYLETVYKHMCITSCELQIPKDLTSLIYYFANYTSKNKDYQNVSPEKYHGTRFWGRRTKNYGNIRKDPVLIAITEDMYDDIYRVVSVRWKKEKKSKCLAKGKTCNDCKTKDKCLLYRKNGLYHPNPLAILNKFYKNGLFDKSIQEEEFYEQLSLHRQHIADAAGHQIKRVYFSKERKKRSLREILLNL